MAILIDIFNFLSLILVGTRIYDGFSAVSFIMGVLFIIGLAGIFRKSGVSPFWALVPCYRMFVLAKCADREAEGKALFFAELFYELDSLFSEFYSVENFDETTRILLSILTLTVFVILRIYTLRVFYGLDEVYGRKRRHIWIWLFFRGISAMVTGYSKKWQPSIKVENLREESLAAISGSTVKPTDTGLSVNLEERTVNDFMHKKCLLRDIHLNIKPGHMVLLLGGSGAGKTTFLNAVNGYEKAKAKVFLNGTDVYANYKKIKYDIGFVPQQNLMRGKDTVENTINDASKLRLPLSVRKADMIAREKEVMEIFGLYQSRKNMVEKLSGGMLRRLSIAMEVVSTPSLFILDEPDSGLDGVMARELMVQLRKIADQGKIVIVITHTPDRVIDLFDDVIVLARDKDRVGRLAFYGPVEEARAFFDRKEMEKIVMAINSKNVGGEGRADEFIEKYASGAYAEVANG